MRYNTLPEWLLWLETLHLAEIDLGLVRVQQVASQLGLPLGKGSGGREASPQIVLVAGTNGKGSTIHLLDAALTAAGLKTARYTSPHLIHFTERVVINGQAVDEALFCEALNAVDQARATCSLTYFEFTTLAAFYCFARSELDIWLVEVGLGGRLDAVNILEPDISVITSIGIDHQSFLGETKNDIAAEKVAIARPGKPLVYGDSQLYFSVAEFSQQHGVSLYRRGLDFGVDINNGQPDVQGVTWVEGWGEVHLPHSPLVTDNMATALQVLNLLPWSLSPDVIAQSFAQVQLAGRCQLVNAFDRQWLLDVAHNPAAMKQFIIQWQGQGLPEAKIGILAMMADKDVAGVLPYLKGKASQWYVSEFGHQRALASDQMALLASPILGHVMAVSSIQTAMEQAIQQTSSQDLIVVTGSFFTAAESLEFLQGGTAN